MSQIEFHWDAEISVGDTIGLNTSAGWAHSVNLATEHVSFEELVRQVPKFFENRLVPYKNIGGMEAEIPFIEVRLARFFDDLNKLNDVVVAGGVFGSVTDFVGRTVYSDPCPFQVTPGVSINIQLSEDGMAQYFRGDVTVDVGIKRVSDEYTTPVRNQKLSPQLVQQLARSVLEYMPLFMRTQWGELYLQVCIAHFIGNMGWVDEHGERNVLQYILTLDYAGEQFDLIFSRPNTTFGE